MKILILDIETAPLLGFVWNPWEVTMAPGQMQTDYFILTWAAKWRGEDAIYSDALEPAESRKQDDKRIVKSLGKLIKGADMVLAHNLDRFDLKRINTRLLFHQLKPIPPVGQLDTLKMAKRSFGVTYNRLDYLGEFLGLGKKFKVEFDLWERCYFGEQKAFDEMLAYNVEDVRLLERVFEFILPYVKRMPRLVDPQYNEEEACTTCGSHNLMKRGFYRTNVSLFQRFECKDCGRYCKYRRSEKLKFATSPL